MKIEKIDYKGWPNSYRLSNNLIDLVMTTDMGPLIRLEPKDNVEHREDWHLFDGVATPSEDGEVVRNVLLKIAQMRPGMEPK